jgi:hypothetical protein
VWRHVDDSVPAPCEVFCCLVKQFLSFSKVSLSFCSVVVTADVGSAAVVAAATSLWAPDVALRRLLFGLLASIRSCQLCLIVATGVGSAVATTATIATTLSSRFQLLY